MTKKYSNSNIRRLAPGACIAVVMLLAMGIYLASDYLLAYALTPAQRYARSEYITMTGERHPALKGWIDSLDAHGTLRDTFLIRADGVRLHAYILPYREPSTRTVVFLHGYTDYGLKFLPAIFAYQQYYGYNVVMPDLYAHGLSQGDYIQFGWNDREDARCWAAMAHEVWGGDVVVHGVSMGAATAMMLSGMDDLPSYVRAFIADCGYTGVWEELSYQLGETFHLPAFPLLYASSLLCKARHGWSFGQASSLRQVERCTRPMLFIHGSHDTFVPTAMVYELYRHKPQPKELWVVPGVRHARAMYDAPLEYRSVMKLFLEKYGLLD